MEMLTSVLNETSRSNNDIINFFKINSTSSATSLLSNNEESAKKWQPKKPNDEVTFGTTRNYTSYFMKCRESIVNETAVITNQLIIRLDQLVNQSPKDPVKRKEFERKVVPWTADSESLYCRGCAAKFGLTKRKHHCRLCGRVMCGQCSKFLGFLSAKKLTACSISFDLSEQGNDDESTEKGKQQSGETEGTNGGGGGVTATLRLVKQATEGRMKSLLEAAVAKVNEVRDGEGSSVVSLLQQDASECLRVCTSCLNHLHRREQQMEQRCPPALAELYATLDTYINKCNALATTYHRMAQSINDGDTIYTLKGAEETKSQLQSLQKQVDTLSKRIADEGSEEEGAHQTGQIIGRAERKLRQAVRAVALINLQNVLQSMIPLPSPEEFDKLVAQRRIKMASQLEKREAQMATMRTSNSMSAMTDVMKNKAMSSLQESRQREPHGLQEGGFTAQQTRRYNPFLEEEDALHPLYEQRDNIRGFLEQAVSMGRLEEVKMLEKNLRELNEEISRLGLEP